MSDIKSFEALFSGLNFNFGGRDYGSSLEITEEKKSHQDEETLGRFFLIQTK